MCIGHRNRNPEPKKELNPLKFASVVEPLARISRRPGVQLIALHRGARVAEGAFNRSRSDGGPVRLGALAQRTAGTVLRCTLNGRAAP